MPLLETTGNNSEAAYGGGVAVTPVYIENVFSTYLYTGTGATQTITNGIDLAGKGGLVWLKQRTVPSGTGYHFLFDSARGYSSGDSANGYARLSTNTTGAEGTNPGIVSYPFNSNGFSLLSDSGGWGPNQSGSLEVSWTFRKQPKFFDVVTGTTDGSGGITINHSLGSVPGCVIMKATGTTSEWSVYHRSLPAGYELVLNTTAAQNALGLNWNATSTTFGAPSGMFSPSTAYVFYLFAHDAGGFGSDGTQNVISCGSFSAGGVVNLGYEPQWVMTKKYDGAGAWDMVDTMRGFVAPPGTTTKYLDANTSNAEASWGGVYGPTSTGFDTSTLPAGNYIYIAIRRGPMQTPTTGTSVFDVSVWPGTYGSGNQYTGFPVDSWWDNYWPGDSSNTYIYDRLRRFSSTNSSLTGGYLSTSNTNAQNDSSGSTKGWYNDQYNQTGGLSNINYAFGRAPGFFDVVCYTGTGSAGQTYTHNLGVTPEFMIVKCRSTSGTYWICYNPALGNNGSYPNYIALNDPSGKFNGASSVWATGPTSTQFSVGASGDVGGSGRTYVTYLFASCPGVSKVGSYTGTGAAQTINCGFTGGARFVLIKRTDSTGDWYVWDTTQGMVSGTDPYILLNSAGARVTGTDYVYTSSTGFTIQSGAPAAINASGGTFIYLAIA